MSFTDALSRISAIQQQMMALTDGVSSTAQSGTSANATSTSPGTASDSTSGQFAQALAQAQLSEAGGASADGSLGGSSSLLGSASGTASSQDPSALSDLLTGSPTGLSGLLGQGASTELGVAATPGDADELAGSSATLPASATAQMTAGQQQFASTLVSETGMNPSVVSAWLLAEENGGAAQTRQSADNNDWLNIGYTDSGPVGAGDSIWSDPTTAANATAAWLKGQDSIPGYGTASSGIQSILSSVGQPPADQIAALQNSGWASSGYPSLPSLYSELSAGTQA